MEIDIKEKRRKTKIIGIRLYKEEYDLISSIAKEKNASRSYVAESILRVGIEELKSQFGNQESPPSRN